MHSYKIIKRLLSQPDALKRAIKSPGALTAETVEQPKDLWMRILSYIQDYTE